MLTAADITRIKQKITTILQSHAGVSPATTVNLLPNKNLQGKLYEAHVMASICENLVIREGFRITLAGGTNLVLRQKGGPIDRKYPYFQVWDGTTLFGELFTDIYFKTLSYELKGSTPRLTSGDFHELDIAVVKPSLTGLPKPSEVLLAVECKNTSIIKSIIREVLGFRRELSYYSHNANTTSFKVWPVPTINAKPASVHMLFCSDNRINRFTSNCEKFGIILQYHKM
ncbi:MAG: hypothetical protein WCO44_07090 [Bacteroidota bacterium]